MREAKIPVMLCVINILLVMGANIATAENGLSGKWSLQDQKNTLTVVGTAVDEAESNMNLIIWLFNQSFIKNEARVCKVWRLLLKEKEFIWKCDDQKTQKISTIAKRLESTKEDGTKIESTFTFTANHISIIEKADFIERTNAWTKISDNQMEYTYIMKSANLPKPLMWTLVYKRQ